MAAELLQGGTSRYAGELLLIPFHRDTAILFSY
jgi:hypothetical protein